MAETQHIKRIYQKEPKKKALGLGLKITLLGLTLAISGAALLFLFYAKDLPRPERFSEITLSQPTKIYDKTGEVLLYELFGEEKRVILSLSEIPDHLKQAIIATEDAKFYSHFGLDLQGIARALMTNIQVGSRSQGGSTISQQLVRSSFLSRQKTIERKFREVVLTLELERRYSKDELLEFYLNQVPFGSNAYGVGAASELYFEKEAKDITLEEAAILAAMIQAPTYYSPYGEHTEDLFGRKDYVLNRMKQENFISSEEAEEAKTKTLTFAQSTDSIKAPHFVLDVVEELTTTYGEQYLRTSGLKVYTTLDWKLQQYAQ
ncbi:MAG: transglycosylase domain-containing protein, partial [archaeon]|nr:transglycosylase domain-containing protein [archaeon]